MRQPPVQIDTTGAVDGDTLVFNGALDEMGFAPPIHLPAGGLTGQVLTKASGADYDAIWSTPASGGGGGGTETWDAAVAAVTGAVHRWKFDETSGSTVADAIGSLTLTLSGTAGANYNRNITGPAGFNLATQFINAHADSGSIGSVPVGSADRTIGVVFRTASQAQQVPWAYGTAAAYQLLYPALNQSGITALPSAIAPSVGGGADLMGMATVPVCDSGWHLLFIGLRGSGKNRFGYIDGIYAQAAFTTPANTISTGFFRVGQQVDTTVPLVGDVADLVVWNRSLLRTEMDRLLRAAAL